MWDLIWRWETLWWLMLILYVPSCAGLIIIVLLQKGKGVGFAGAFGLGAGSDTVFGPRSRKSLPARLTHIMAAVFMVLAFCMSMIAGKLGKGIAPEKVDVVETESAVASGLDDLGLGTGEVGAVVQPSAPAPPTPPPAAVPVEKAVEQPAAPPAETQSAAPQTDAVEEAPAPAQDEPAPDAVQQ